MRLNLLAKREACRVLHFWTEKRLKARQPSKNAHSVDSESPEPPSLAFSDLFAGAMGHKSIALTQEMKEDISVKSALCIIPPEHIWPPIQEIRKYADPAYKRWMPHINIFFPFIDEKWFDDIAEYIGEIVRKRGIQSFEITLGEFDHFDRVKRGMQSPAKPETLFLRPSGCEREMQRLWKCLKDEWPLCASKQGGGFTPHLTMSKRIICLRNAKEELNKKWKKLSFECDELCLISRRGDDPFVVRHRIPLL